MKNYFSTSFIRKGRWIVLAAYQIAIFRVELKMEAFKVSLSQCRSCNQCYFVVAMLIGTSYRQSTVPIYSPCLAPLSSPIQFGVR